VLIDGHAHACGNLLDPEGIRRTLDANGVDKVVLVPGQHQSAKTYRLPNLAKYFPTREVANVTNALTRVVVRAAGSARHVEKDNETVFGLATSCAGRVIQFYWVMLGHGFDLATVDACYRSWKFKGFKVHQCWDDFDVRGEAFGALTAYASVHDLPVFIHLNGARQVKELIEVAAARPEATFIVGHLYGVEHFMGSPRAIPNVYFDLSCPDVVSVVRLAAALDHFGARRLIFGSDTPFGRDNIARGIDRIRSLDIPESDKELILGGNMARSLRMDSTATM
jgi:predicted TIM-barrel fold metal-dependent hydrolase